MVDKGGARADRKKATRGERGRSRYSAETRSTRARWEEEQQSDSGGERARYVRSTTAAPVRLYERAEENEPRRASFSDTVGGGGGTGSQVCRGAFFSPHLKANRSSSSSFFVWNVD